MNIINEHQRKNLPSKTIGLLALYGAKLINDNKSTLDLCEEEISFFQHAEENPGYAHLNADILFNAFYNLSTTDLKNKFEDKVKQLTN